MSTNAASLQRSCPVCGVDPGDPFVTLTNLPVHTNVLWESREEALRAPRGDLVLASCESCGLIWNTAFDADLLNYDSDYENSLHFSPTFQRYAEALADRLIERYGVRGKTVVEIGSGKGEFLTLICAKGGNRGIGFDPSYDGESDRAAVADVGFRRELYTEASATEDADLVVCRHVLEHVEDPLSFLEAVRRAVSGPETTLYFEVPAAEHLLRQAAAWDVIYAHVTIFGETALRRLFERAGFRVLDTGFSFENQYLWIEAVPAAGARRQAEDRPPEKLRELVDSFARAVEDKRRLWERRLTDVGANGAVAVWGAGAKGATFLNLVPGGDRISTVVDVNPRKHGKHVAGTGQLISSPEELASNAPDVECVIVMNPIYRDEIAEQVAGRGLSPVVEAL